MAHHSLPSFSPMLPLLLLPLLLLLTQMGSSQKLQIQNKLPKPLNLTCLYSTDIEPQRGEGQPKQVRHFRVSAYKKCDIPFEETPIDFAVVCFVDVETEAYGMTKTWRKKVMLYNQAEPLLYGVVDAVWQAYDVGLFLNEGHEPIIRWEDSADTFPPPKQQHTQYTYSTSPAIPTSLTSTFDSLEQALFYPPHHHQQQSYHLHSGHTVAYSLAQQQQTASTSFSPAFHPQFSSSSLFNTGSHATAYSSAQQQQQQQQHQQQQQQQQQQRHHENP